MSNNLGDMWFALTDELREMYLDDLLSPAEVLEIMAKIEEENA